MTALVAPVLRAAARDVLQAAAGEKPPLVLIDGRSGAGKSTLARLVVAGWPGAQLLALDDVYPGWDGLDAGVETVCRDVVRPYAADRVGRWRAWDWAADAPGAVHDVDPARPLVVEGCGILTADTMPLAPVRVWLEAAAGIRRRRALDRDGDAYRPHWDRWAAQEERHLRRDRPRARATHTFTVE